MNFDTNVILPEIPEIPKNETLWVQGYDEQGALHYVITSTKLRDRYFLYIMEEGVLKKKLSARTPLTFRRYI